MLMNKALKRLLKPAWRAFVNVLPSKWHVDLDHFMAHGRLPNLGHPKTFSEKIAYRKLYDRDPRMPPLVDKIVSKELMAARFGPDFIIPTLATFESEKEIDFGALPYPCVVKANHGSGMNIFLKQQPENEKEVRRQLRRFLRYDHYKTSEEWAYSQVHKRPLVEPFIDGGEHGLIDYKFHTFGGRVFAIQVDVDRYTNHGRCFFDSTWKRMRFELLYPKASYDIFPPGALDKMLYYAEYIGEGFSYVRVDLYEIEGEVKFGEATFYPGAGLENFRPPEFEVLVGEQWNSEIV